jgi:soluble lytic murein transglycosylase-like protein
MKQRAGACATTTLRTALAAACLLVGSALPLRAGAQVIEIGDDGAAVTYAGPTVFTDAGATPITVPVHAASRARLAPAPKAEVVQQLNAAAQAYALSPALVEAVAWRESGLRHEARSPKGAMGVMQLTPATAAELGVDGRDLAQNVHGGAAYLRRMLNQFGGDLTLSLAAYNAGPGAVQRYGGVPPFAETQAYVAAILNRLAQRAIAP